MKFSEFEIGGTFWCSDKKYECTDIGSRVIVAIRIDQVEVIRNGAFAVVRNRRNVRERDPFVRADAGTPAAKETLTFQQAKKEGWFSGPPYAVEEIVFDEYDLPACSTSPE